MMGCDIHIVAQRKLTSDEWEDVDCSPFDWRDYSVFAFLAGVRNYAAIRPISVPRGLPDDILTYYKERDYLDQTDPFGIYDADLHSHSWLSVEELTNFDYDQQIENRRATKQIASNVISGNETCEVGDGEQTTYRLFLGEAFFTDLKELQNTKADRIVFCFDN